MLVVCETISTARLSAIEAISVRRWVLQLLVLDDRIFGRRGEERDYSEVGSFDNEREIYYWQILNWGFKASEASRAPRVWDRKAARMGS